MSAPQKSSLYLAVRMRERHSWRGRDHGEERAQGRPDHFCLHRTRGAGRLVPWKHGRGLSAHPCDAKCGARGTADGADGRASCSRSRGNRTKRTKRLTTLDELRNANGHVQYRWGSLLVRCEIAHCYLRNGHVYSIDGVIDHGLLFARVHRSQFTRHSTDDRTRHRLVTRHALVSAPTPFVCSSV